MNFLFKRVITIGLLLSTLFLANSFAKEGKVIGASNHTVPEWFKKSFLEIAEDVDEATQDGKHFMIFFDFEGCPYCSKMLKESFEEKNETSDFVKKYFDVIELNVKGSKEVTWVDEDTLSEKDLAAKLKIQYSPTVIFFDENKEIIARVNGYRNNQDFKDILKFVQSKSYLNVDLLSYLKSLDKKDIYKLKKNNIFSNITDLSKIKTPLAIIFEDSSCIQCEHFHNKILTNKDVKDEFSKYKVVRFDANSNLTIITPEGKKISPKTWVEDLNLDYRPGVLLYNEGELKSTIDALLFPFHFKEVLRYVSGKFYMTYPNSYLDYLKVRQDELIKSGVDINVAE